MKRSMVKKASAFLILGVATFSVLGYILYVSTYLVLNFNLETIIVALVGLPAFIFFFNFLWSDV